LWDMKKQKLCPKCKVHYCNLEDSQCDVCSGKSKLCNKCNKNYHDIRYATCFDCSSKKAEWEKTTRMYRVDDYLLDYCYHKKECPIVNYSYINSRRGGSAYKCNVKKACKKYPDVIRIKDE